MNTPSELALFERLATDLSTREVRARALIPAAEQARGEQIIGVGRYVMGLGSGVGVFVRGTVHPESGMPDQVVVDFVASDPVTGRADVAGKAVYAPYEGLVTVTDRPESQLSVAGLAKAVAGIDLGRGEPAYPGGAFRASVEELEFIRAFAEGDAENPTVMHSFHFVGQPGKPGEGIEISPVGDH